MNNLGYYFGKYGIKKDSIEAYEWEKRYEERFGMK